MQTEDLQGWDQLRHAPLTVGRTPGPASTTSMFEPESTSNLPPQIAAAMDFLRLARSIEAPFCFDGPTDRGRLLSKGEAEVYDSALTVLIEFFNLPLRPCELQPQSSHESKR
jgi:hypothetical protein